MSRVHMVLFCNLIVPPEQGTGSRQLFLQMLPGSLLLLFLRRELII